MTAEFTTDIYFARGSVVSRYNGDISKSVGTVERLFIEDGIKIIGEKVALFDSADGARSFETREGGKKGKKKRLSFIIRNLCLFFATVFIVELISGIIIFLFLYVYWNLIKYIFKYLRFNDIRENILREKKGETQRKQPACNNVAR